MKRVISTIQQIDYTSKDEFLKDILKMKEAGYRLIENGMFYGVLQHGEIQDNEWAYTAYFVKSEMM
jgi:hypothetical protein